MVQRKLLVLLMLLCFMFVACVSLTPRQQYAFALKEYTMTLKKYNDWYDIQKPEVQAKWKATIDPKFLALDLALETYNAALVGGGDYSSEEEKYLAAKSEVLKLLLEAGVIKVEDKQ